MFCDICNSLLFFGIVGCQAEARKCCLMQRGRGGSWWRDNWLMLRLIWPEFTLASITRISSANGRLCNDSDVSSPDRAGLIKFCLQGIEHSGLPPQDPGHYAFFLLSTHCTATNFPVIEFSGLNCHDGWLKWKVKNCNLLSHLCRCAHHHTCAPTDWDWEIIWSPTFTLQSSGFQEVWILNPPKSVSELLPRRTIAVNDGEAKEKKGRQDTDHSCLEGNSVQTINGLSHSRRKPPLPHYLQKVITPSSILLLLFWSLHNSITSPSFSSIPPSSPGMPGSNHQLEHRLRKLLWSVKRGLALAPQGGEGDNRWTTAFVTELLKSIFNSTTSSLNLNHISYLWLSGAWHKRKILSNSKEKDPVC